MQNVPVQHQKLGVCYAYAAAQLVDAVRHKRQLEKPKPKVDDKESSPVFLAVNTAEAWNREKLYYKNKKLSKKTDKPVTLDEITAMDPHFPFEGGHLCDAFETAKNLGTCTNKKIEEQKFFEKLLMVQENYLQERRNDLPQFSGYPVYSPVASVDLSEINACKKEFFPNVWNTIEELVANIDDINKEVFEDKFTPAVYNSPDALRHLFNEIVCPNNEHREIVDVKGSCKVYDVEDALSDEVSYSFTRKIIEKLEKTSLPVGISYCSKMLKEPKIYIKTKTKDKLEFKEDCGQHASLVIGSRFVQGKDGKDSCELLIRNTWGKGCENYHKDHKCEDGNIWVDFKILNKNTYRIQHL